MKIAVTGNIGCGKSTFVKLLLDLMPDYRHFDFDGAVHELYEDPEFLRSVESLFGTSERKAVSDIVFHDADKKAALERLSAGHLRPRLNGYLRMDKVLVEFPLLFESGWNLKDFDLIVTVDCSADTQIARIKARNGFSDEKIAAIRASQCDSALKAALADVLISSECSLDELSNRARALTQTIRKGDLRQRCLNEFGSEALWSAIEGAYSQAPRKYHTLQHLHAMFLHYDKVASQLKHPRAVRWAIWFHDFVYQTKAPMYSANELLSAQAMFRLIREHCPDYLAYVERNAPCITLAAEMIVATKEHRPTAAYFGTRAEAEADCRVFLDIDLIILSKPEHVVNAFDEAVRSEFWMYSDVEFAAGRIQALTSFLNREQIYFSPEFQNAEQAARNNLRMLINRWEQVKE